MSTSRSIRCLWVLGSLAVLASPKLVSAFLCPDPEPPHKLALCSPDSTDLSWSIIPEGLQISWEAPSRQVSSFLSPLMAERWGLPEGDPVPGIEVSGTYMGVADQRIQIAVVQIGAGLDSGVVGVDAIKVVWSSVYELVSGAFNLDASNVDTPLPFTVETLDGPPDTTVVPGVRITFQSGFLVWKDSTAVFDVEDFEGYHVWRWGSDPTLSPIVVGSYGKLADVPRPDGFWPGAAPLARRFTFVDNFVIDGITYHYAVTSFDQGFDRERGGTATAMPFDSRRPPATSRTQLGETQIRVDFLRPPPEEFLPVVAFPNPFRDSECDPQREVETCRVFFKNLPPRGRLLIYTVAGDLVEEIEHPSDGNASGTLQWDTTNAAGKKVASGVYIFKIIDLVSGEESFGRLAIIR
ncbi:MAG: hypothetical protein ACE5G2_08640 [Candidatus Krumholzibacteriia bacterium]